MKRCVKKSVSLCLQASEENGRRDGFCSAGLRSGHTGGGESCGKRAQPLVAEFRKETLTKTFRISFIHSHVKIPAHRFPMHPGKPGIL